MENSYDAQNKLKGYLYCNNAKEYVCKAKQT